MNPFSPAAAMGALPSFLSIPRFAMRTSYSESRVLSKSAPLAAILAVMVVTTLVTPTPAHAGGFYVAEQNAAGTARGMAVVADPQGPGTLMLNPAGMSKIAGQQLFAVELGTTYVTGAPTWTSPDGSLKQKAKAGHHFLPNLYFTAMPIKNFALGVGVYAPFGLGNEWPSDWAGREAVTKVQLASIFINPAVSYRIELSDDWDLSLGAGFYAVWGGVTLKRALARTGPRGMPVEGGDPFGALTDGMVTISGDTWGFGGHAGILLTGRFGEHRIALGGGYRSPVEINLDDGKAKFDVRESAAYDLQSGAVKTSLTLPQLFQVGLAYGYQNFTIEVDFGMTFWSSYDKLTFKFASGTVSEQRKTWSDVWTLRAGLQYNLPIGDHTVAFRAGYIFDKNPAPDKSLDPLLPDSDRHIPSLGLGYSFAGFNVDVAYMLVLFNERTVKANDPATAAAHYENFPGTYSTTLHLVGLSLGYRM